MAHSEEHPETLRNNVTSPNGTTQAALETFAAGNPETSSKKLSPPPDRSVELAQA